MHVKTSYFLFCMRNVPALNYPEQRAHGSRNQPAQLKAVCLQMYFIKDCCYIKKKNINKDYILYNNKEVLFCKLSVSCVSLGN